MQAWSGADFPASHVVLSIGISPQLPSTPSGHISSTWQILARLSDVQLRHLCRGEGLVVADEAFCWGTIVYVLYGYAESSHEAHRRDVSRDGAVHHARSKA